MTPDKDRSRPGGGGFEDRGGDTPRIADLTGNGKHEPSAWLRMAARRRISQLGAHPTSDPTTGVYVIPQPDGTRVVRATLHHTAPARGSVEDRTCDRCRTYCAPTANAGPFTFFCFMHPVDRYRLRVGLCAPCTIAEFGVLPEGTEVIA